MTRPRIYRVSAVLDGEDVEVEIAVGPAEPPGTPFAGYREVEVVSARTLDGTDVSAQADQLDLSALAGDALDAEEDALDAAADDQSDRDREERYEF